MSKTIDWNATYEAFVKRNHEVYGTDVRCPVHNTGLGKHCLDAKGEAFSCADRLAARPR